MSSKNAVSDVCMSKCFVHREGTDVDAADKDGCTPLLVAARQGCSEAFAKLLEKADFEKRDNGGSNAILLSAKAGHSAILEVRSLDYLS